MDKWLTQDVAVFDQLLKSKGYTGPFVVSHKFSGEFQAAVAASAFAAESGEYNLFPLIVQTLIKTEQAAELSQLTLRVDHREDGLVIRDASIDKLKINGKTKYNLDIPFKDTVKFPSSLELMGKLERKYSRKTKARGL